MKGLDPAAVDLPEGTAIFINEILRPYYRGICKEVTYKKLWDKPKVYQYYTTNGLLYLQIEESGQAKNINHIVDLQNLFLDIEINSL